MAFDDIAGDLCSMARAEAIGHTQTLARHWHIVDLMSAHLEPGGLEMIDPLAAATAVGTLVDIDHFGRRCRQGDACAQGKYSQENSDGLRHENIPQEIKCGQYGVT